MKPLQLVLLLPLLGLLLLGGCAYLSQPDATVSNQKIMLMITNNSIDGWRDCTITLNPTGPVETQFSATKTSLAGEKTAVMMFTQFKNAAGKRFVLFVDKADSVRIHCAQPLLPIDLPL